MKILVVSVLGPLAVASVLIGIVNAVGTPWGLVRHYWVLVKLLLTLLAATVLLVEIPTVVQLAESAAVATDPRELPGTLPHSVGGLAILLITVILSVFKPPGMTKYGWRSTGGSAAAGPIWRWCKQNELRRTVSETEVRSTDLGSSRPIQ